MSQHSQSNTACLADDASAGVELDIEARFMVLSGKESPCRVIRISPREMVLVSAIKPDRGEKIILYINDFGRFEGVVTRHRVSNFAIALNLSPQRAQRLSYQLTRVESRQPEQNISYQSKRPWRSEFYGTAARSADYGVTLEQEADAISGDAATDPAPKVQANADPIEPVSRNPVLGPSTNGELVNSRLDSAAHAQEADARPAHRGKIGVEAMASADIAITEGVAHAIAPQQPDERSLQRDEGVLDEKALEVAETLEGVDRAPAPEETNEPLAPLAAADDGVQATASQQPDERPSQQDEVVPEEKSPEIAETLEAVDAAPAPEKTDAPLAPLAADDDGVRATAPQQADERPSQRDEVVPEEKSPEVAETLEAVDAAPAPEKTDAPLVSADDSVLAIEHEEENEPTVYAHPIDERATVSNAEASCGELAPLEAEKRPGRSNGADARPGSSRAPTMVEGVDCAMPSQAAPESWIQGDGVGARMKAAEIRDASETDDRSSAPQKQEESSPQDDGGERQANAPGDSTATKETDAAAGRETSSDAQLQDLITAIDGGCVNNVSTAEPPYAGEDELWEILSEAEQGHESACRENAQNDEAVAVALADWQAAGPELCVEDCVTAESPAQDPCAFANATVDSGDDMGATGGGACPKRDADALDSDAEAVSLYSGAMPAGRASRNESELEEESAIILQSEVDGLFDMFELAAPDDPCLVELADQPIATLPFDAEVDDRERRVEREPSELQSVRYAFGPKFAILEGQSVSPTYRWPGIDSGAPCTARLSCGFLHLPDNGSPLDAFDPTSESNCCSDTETSESTIPGASEQVCSPQPGRNVQGGRFYKIRARKRGLMQGGYRTGKRGPLSQTG